MASTISAGLTTGTAIALSGDTSGALVLQTNGTTTAVTIDTSQNVGIGTSSPATLLHLGRGQSVIRFGATSNGFDIGRDEPTGCFIQNATEASPYNQFIWQQSGTERMRIDSSGTVLMGQTTNPATGTLVLKVPTGTGNGINAQITSNTGTSYPFSNYNASSTYVGGISCTSSATAFPTSSDVRLKKNIADAPSAISKVLTAKVVSHDWINDGHHVEYGFVAQDLQDIIPQAVIEGTNKEDGSMDMPWGVDYSKIVPLLVKSIQEQQALILALTTRISALEAK